MDHMLTVDGQAGRLYLACSCQGARVMLWDGDTSLDEINQAAHEHIEQADREGVASPAMPA